jgi:ABC-type branched-subunit amino acid transport system substrate-binding protein
MRSFSRRATTAFAGLVIVLVAGGSGLAQIRPRAVPSSPSSKPAPPGPAPAGDAGPTLRIGALLPLSGASGWYGKEMRQGMELAVADLTPAGKSPEIKGPEGKSPEGKGPEGKSPEGKPPDGTPAETRTPKPKIPESKTPEGKTSETKTEAGRNATSPRESGAPTGASPGSPPGRQAGEPGAAPATEPTPESGPPTVRVALEVVDVEPLDVKAAETGFAKLTGNGSMAIFTASPTPTLAVYPLAAARDVLVVHQGLPSDRIPGGSRTLLQLRPSAAARGDALAAYAWERGIRRLALMSGGDEFGKAVRAAVVARWRNLGAAPVADESLSLDASDLRTRVGRVARLGPDAVCLAFQGVELGTLAAGLRDAGYGGLVLALDDDRGALLAAGPTLGDVIVLSDAFVPEPGSSGSRFARAYETKHGHAPSRFAANAYEAVKTLAEAARLSAEAGRPVTGGGRLREALLARRTFPSVYGGELRVRDDGTLEHPLALFTVAQGKATFVRYVTPAGRPVMEGRQDPDGDAAASPTP